MIEWSDLERPAVQFATREAVVAAMGSPLREPILEAVEERVEGVDLDDAEPNRDAAGTTEGETDAADTTEGETDADESADGGPDSAVIPLVGLLALLALVVAVAYVLRRRIGGE